MAGTEGIIILQRSAWSHARVGLQVVLSLGISFSNTLWMFTEEEMQALDFEPVHVGTKREIEET